MGNEQLRQPEFREPTEPKPFPTFTMASYRSIQDRPAAFVGGGSVQRNFGSYASILYRHGTADRAVVRTRHELMVMQLERDWRDRGERSVNVKYAEIDNKADISGLLIMDVVNDNVLERTDDWLEGEQALTRVIQEAENIYLDDGYSLEKNPRCTDLQKMYCSEELVKKLVNYMLDQLADGKKQDLLWSNSIKEHLIKQLKKRNGDPEVDEEKLSATADYITYITFEIFASLNHAGDLMVKSDIRNFISLAGEDKQPEDHIEDHCLLVTTGNLPITSLEPTRLRQWFESGMQKDPQFLYKIMQSQNQLSEDDGRKPLLTRLAQVMPNEPVLQGLKSEADKHRESINRPLIIQGYRNLCGIWQRLNVDVTSAESQRGLIDRIATKKIDRPGYKIVIDDQRITQQDVYSLQTEIRVLYRSSSNRFPQIQVNETVVDDPIPKHYVGGWEWPKDKRN